MKPLSKRDIDILEERGLWKASSWLHKINNRLIRKKLSLEIRYIKEAHRKIFFEANQENIAGQYRKHNGPELKRIDGTILAMTDWRQVPNKMAELDFELRQATKNLGSPKTPEDYRTIISLAAKLSHRLACIHPFGNGNGRASRLLLNAILIRAGLSDIAIKKSKQTYLRAMRQADDGDRSLLEDLIVGGLRENKLQVYKQQRRKQAELAQFRFRHKKR